MAVTTAFAMLAAGCGSLTFWPTYHSLSFVVMVTATVAIGSGIALFGAIYRVSSAIVALSTVGAYLLFGVALAVPGEAIAGVFPSWSGLSDLIAGAALGWKQLVTISTPVGSYQALLVPAFLLVLIVSVASLTVALRARRGEWALVFPIALFALGIALGPDEVDAPALPALALIVVLVLWLARIRISRRTTALAALREQSGAAVETRTDRRRSWSRSVLSAGLVVAVAAGAGTAAAVFVPSTSTRDVVRSSLAQPFDPRDYPSPLTGFRNYLGAGKADEPMLTVSGLDGERRIRIATLDTYDGVVYAVGGPSGSDASGTFTRVPGRLDQSASGKRTSIMVAVDGYRGVWLPGVGALSLVQFEGKNAAALQNSVYNNSITDTSAVLAGLTAGDRYRLDAAAVPSRTITQLKDLTPGDAVLPKVGVVPDGIDQAIQDAAGTQRHSGARLASALTMLVDKGYISHGIAATDPASRSGHGADRITQLLTDVPMVGDQEQYAVAAALMARRIGFPARVVVGFVVPAGTSTAGTVTLTGSDISAWIQVQTRQDGWVNVDPNPAVRPIPKKQPDEPKKISRPETAVQPPADDTRNDTPTPPQSRVIHTPNQTPNAFIALLLAIARIVGFSLLGIAIVLAPFLAVVVAKWRRRWKRRSAPGSLSRITGGWREFSDAALDHGFEPPQSATRSEIANAVGGMRPLVLATVADRAVFAPTSPTDADADRVWQAVDELRRSMGTGKTRWQRIMAAVSLASLGGYRRRDRKPGSAK